MIFQGQWYYRPQLWFFKDSDIIDLTCDRVLWHPRPGGERPGHEVVGSSPLILIALLAATPSGCYDDDDTSDRTLQLTNVKLPLLELWPVEWSNEDVLQFRVFIHISSVSLTLIVNCPTLLSVLLSVIYTFFLLFVCCCCCCYENRGCLIAHI